MINNTDDYSWEQVYGLMRCTTRFEGANIDSNDDEENIEIEYFEY